jgi:hypothetical protein
VNKKNKIKDQKKLDKPQEPHQQDWLQSLLEHQPRSFVPSRGRKKMSESWKISNDIKAEAAGFLCMK